MKFHRFEGNWSRKEGEATQDHQALREEVSEVKIKPEVPEFN